MHFPASTLLLALPLALLAGAAPGHLGGRQTPSFCNTLSQSEDFAWQLVDFEYHGSYIYSTRSHQVVDGYVRFNVTNPAVPFTAVCEAHSVQLEDFFDGKQTYTCAPGAGKTTFTFSRPDGALAFNQTWGCPDPKYPITFFGYASANLDLTCNDTTYQNPNWTLGQIYSRRSVDCAPVSLPVKPYAWAAIA